MKATLSSKGRLVLPAELRDEDGIEAGQVFEIERSSWTCGDAVKPCRFSTP
jgi:bifunctional DNA-binding transcriptional regulator/antitoxin component of YhaV-PrlF toxin-antitoxin module